MSNANNIPRSLRDPAGPSLAAEMTKRRSLPDGNEQPGPSLANQTNMLGGSLESRMDTDAVPSDARAHAAIRTLIRYIGDDPDRPGLIETPVRCIRAWVRDWGRGYNEDPKGLVKVFKEPGQNFDEIVVVRKIALWSTCEHHLAPFFGTADIGYLPNPEVGILGLSKIARILEHFARRLQVQERIGAQVADFITSAIQARGVGVILRARHTCMCSRGVNQQDAETVTSTLRGVFNTTGRAHSEFLQLTR